MEESNRKRPRTTHSGIGSISSTRSISNNNEDDDGEINMEERIILNVGGKRFETLRGTLCKYPKTMLGAMFSSTMAKPSALVPIAPESGAFSSESESGGSEQQQQQQPRRQQQFLKEFFFDRDPDLFGIILNWYRHGKLAIPNTQFCSYPLLQEELNFFGIDNADYFNIEDFRDPTNRGQQMLTMFKEWLLSRINEQELAALGSGGGGGSGRSSSDNEGEEEAGQQISEEGSGRFRRRGPRAMLSPISTTATTTRKLDVAFIPQEYFSLTINSLSQYDDWNSEFYDFLHVAENRIPLFKIMKQNHVNIRWRHSTFKNEGVTFVCHILMCTWTSPRL